MTTLLIRASWGASRESQGRRPAQPQRRDRGHGRRNEALYEEADPKGIVVSAPGIGLTLAAGILGRLGDPTASPTWPGAGLHGPGAQDRPVQSGLENRRKGVTKAGDPGLREALYLAADLARKVDPTLAERYHRLVVDEGRHHISAVQPGRGAATRIAACWRRGEHYVLRDVDGTEITGAESRRICAQRYKVSTEVRAARRRMGKAQQMKAGGSGQ